MRVLTGWKNEEEAAGDIGAYWETLGQEGTEGRVSLVSRTEGSLPSFSFGTLTLPGAIDIRVWKNRTRD